MVTNVSDKCLLPTLYEVILDFARICNQRISNVILKDNDILQQNKRIVQLYYCTVRRWIVYKISSACVVQKVKTGTSNMICTE